MVEDVDGELVEVAVAAIRIGLVFDSVALVVVVAAGGPVVIDVLGAPDVVDNVDMLISAKIDAFAFIWLLIIELC